MKMLKTLNASANSDEKNKETFDANSEVTTSPSTHTNTATSQKPCDRTIKNFTDLVECIHFISNIKEEKVFMISSGTLSQTIVPIIHDMAQINTIFYVL